MKFIHLHTKIASALGLISALALISCQSAPPSIKKRAEANASNQIGSVDSEAAFEAFIEDEPEQDTAEGFTGALFASQLELREGFTISSSSKSGRCLLMLIPMEEAVSEMDSDAMEVDGEAGEKVEQFKSLDEFEGGSGKNKLKITDSGLLLYSEPDRKAGDCEDFFADALGEAYDLHKADLYVSFYRY